MEALQERFLRWVVDGGGLGDARIYGEGGTAKGEIEKEDSG